MTPSNPLVYVRWIDACSQEYIDDPAEAVDGLLLETAGFLVRRTKDTISIAMDFNPTNNPKWRHVCNIPISYVVEVAVIG